MGERSRERSLRSETAFRAGSNPPVVTRGVTRWTYLGLVILLVGFTTAGAGAATHLDERSCASVGVVRVVPTDSVNASLDDYQRVDYTDLTATEQRVFRSVREAGGQALVDRDAIREAAVTYEDETYLVVTATEHGDCTPWDRERVIVPLGMGTGLVLVGGVLVRGRDHDA